MRHDRPHTDTFVARPRGEAMAEMLARIEPPTIAGGAPRALADVIDDWRVSRAAGDEARPCACGHVVIAKPDEPTEGVRAHQQTDHHRHWAATAYGFEDIVETATQAALRRRRAVAVAKAWRDQLRADVRELREARGAP